MAKRFVTVRVVGQDARPKSGKRVAIGGSGFFDGVGNSVYTDREGKAELEIDRDGNIDIYVDGSAVLKNQRIQSAFKITV